MAALKILRWLATAGLVLVALIQLGAGNWFGGLAIGLAASTMWWVPRIAAGPRKAPPKPNAEFNPSIAHDNIALDPQRDLLWIRDPKLGERFVCHGDLLSWRTDQDWNNGTFRQRIELQLRDVNQPSWQVLFQRHSDTWKSSSKKNGQERDEWFARIQAWDRSVPAPPSAQSAFSPDFTLPTLHAQYYRAHSDVDRQNYLMAFDLGCDTQALDPKTEWERLGSEYPGPSAELLKFRQATDQV